jgi:sigma-E factor negative regulatory protein RseA
MEEMKQQISVLMDNELDGDVNQHLLIVTSNTHELKQCWREYHLIGDVLRGDAVLHVDIKHKVIEQLANEPVTLAPPQRILPPTGSRYMTSMAASVAAVAFVAWVVWQSQAVPGPNPTQNAVAQNTAPQNVLTAESFDHYMLAHNEYAPGNTLQHDVQMTSYTEANH